ncbi:hypothetical protein A3K79_06715 [Candidatus Bathyarchaeota archaeon RBG_13_46_16b]|nr:MAG: hypothetical protein A3K79_06715 [Candidatus Bathyarchaeota archaeon RBG_13_46_16b]
MLPSWASIFSLPEDLCVVDFADKLEAYFSRHLPFGTKDAYVREIAAADLDKLPSLLGICGFLIQAKVYLFWKNGENQTF